MDKTGKNIVAITGAICCGKSAMAVVNVSRLNAMYFCKNDIEKQLCQRDNSLTAEQASLKSNKILRRKLKEFIKKGESIIYETEFIDNIDRQILKQAKKQGYNIIYINIGTESPDINIRRVEKRIAEGGPDVDRDTIRQSYNKSMACVKSMLKESDQAYILDNSVDNGQAEVCIVKRCGKVVIVNEEPQWLRTYCI